MALKVIVQQHYKRKVNEHKIILPFFRNWYNLYGSSPSVWFKWFNSLMSGNLCRAQRNLVFQSDISDGWSWRYFFVWSAHFLVKTKIKTKIEQHLILFAALWIRAGTWHLGTWLLSCLRLKSSLLCQPFFHLWNVWKRGSYLLLWIQLS